MNSSMEQGDSPHIVPDHFDTALQAYESSKLGVWLFLVTEILMFGGLFVAYIVFRALNPDMFSEASKHLDKVMGAVNTVVLICSSFTMAMAVNATRLNKHAKAQKLLLATLFFAACFMVVKYFEYSHKIHAGTLPAGLFKASGFTHKNPGLFFSLYFVMTSLHGFHVLVGMGLIFWVYLKSKARKLSSSYYTPVELVGLFWHLVDLIWIYLFPLLYLVG
ncbi:MAG TPA: cytochrome c oxidase subunit 3 family protein [Bdellovibrionota bacterium]|nr:cytochrome c oxidase subunit 3 family protein [Bdellovibrionota bacterium]